MAQQTSVTLVDDLDGGKAVETITFSLDGADYEIDLSKKNATALRKALSQYIESGRKAKQEKAAAPRARARKSSSDDAPSPSAVREWATSQGMDVSPRGRLSGALIKQYLEATS
jgi:hypothetical protein